MSTAGLGCFCWWASAAASPPFPPLFKTLIASQQLLMPALYTGLSVVVGYVALYIGLVLAR